MGFLAPLMLWGVAAASIPVILHLFYRSRYRTVPWAAMKFLLTSVEQTSRRLRFQELLLLAARTLLLALLGLALARPSSISRNASDSEAVDAVLLIDTSYSMGAREGNGVLLDRAKVAALSIIDRLPQHSTAQVVACADRARLLGPVAASNLDQAREIVKSVELSHLSTDFLPGASEAAEALQRGHSVNKEVYLISDLQRRGWDQQQAALTARLQDLGKGAALYLVRCGSRTPRNVSVTGIAAQSGIPHTGERVGFAVLLRNSGAEAVQNLTVTLEVDGRTRDRESQPVPLLAPGETLAVTLSAKLDRAGFRTVTATVAPDELEADNRYSKVLPVRDQARVLVVDGASSDLKPENASTFYLMHSLRPVPESAWPAYHLQPRAVTPADASPALLADADACVLVNAPVQAAGENSPGALSSEFVERLAGFVREGKGLLVFAGTRVSPELYNRVFWDEHKLLPARLTGVESILPGATLGIDPNSADPKGFLAAFREEPLSRLDQTHVMQWLGVEDRGQPGVSIDLRYGNRKPLVVTGKAGAGTVMLVTSSADLRWTDWPLRHTYLPFVHVALARLLSGHTDVHNVTAGEPLKWRPPSTEAGKVFTAADPEGRRARLGVPELVDGQPVVTAPNTPRAGVYRILAEGDPSGEGAAFAVTPDLRESEDLETLTDKQIDERLGFAVQHVTAGEDTGSQAGTHRLKSEWTLWVLLAVLALVLFETALAWYCGRGW